MAQQMNSSGENGSLDNIEGEPLALDEDDTQMADIEDEAREDIELERHQRQTRSIAPRTLYHYSRGEDDTLNSTRSLYDTDVVYSWIGGRRYCGEYYMPNDEDEQTRLQMLHGVYLYLFGGELTTVPLDNPRKILDVGTGTGEWAMAMGDKYPDAEIIGTDIARIQPSAVPLNVFMEIDDAEEVGGWTWADDEFDMVHFRYMAGAFMDWKHIYTEAYKHLKPGGWVEVIDFDDHKAVREFFDKEALVPKVLDAIAEAQRRSGRARSVKHLETESLAEVGFVDVRETDYDVPMGIWPDDSEEQRIGKHFLIAQLLAAEALCMRPLVQHLGWDPEDVKKVCSIAAQNLKTLALDPARAKGLGFKMKVLIGRKPHPGEEQDGASVETIKNVNGEVVNGDL